jgi:hypothetical protein
VSAHGASAVRTSRSPAIPGRRRAGSTVRRRARTSSTGREIGSRPTFPPSPADGRMTVRPPSGEAGIVVWIGNGDDRPGSAASAEISNRHIAVAKATPAPPSLSLPSKGSGKC